MRKPLKIDTEFSVESHNFTKYSKFSENDFMEPSFDYKPVRKAFTSQITPTSVPPYQDLFNNHLEISGKNV